MMRDVFLRCFYSQFTMKTALLVTHIRFVCIVLVCCTLPFNFWTQVF